MVVIADDLTGANDTAIQYRKFGVSSIVNVGLSGSQNPDSFKGYDVISVNTDSRALTPQAAYDVVYKTCRLFCSSGNTAVYKKTDSVLRGNPGAELAAVMDALNCSLAFVSSAYPENGRTIRDGILTAGRNRIDAVKCIATDMNRGVCSVSLAVVQQGASAMEQFIADNRKKNAEVFVFDACTDADLESIYSVASGYTEPYVLCGSAGLAQFDAKKLSCSVKHASTLNVAEKEGIILAVTGSRNIETRAQVTKAAEDFSIPCITMDKNLVAQGKADAARTSCMAKIEKRIAAGDSVVLLAVSSLFEDFHMVLKDSEENYRIAEELACNLGKLANAVYEQFPVQAIIANGGDTTMQLCRQLGAYGIEPVAEVTPGTPMGVFIGGKADRIPVITKSGGFGSESVLTESIHFLQNLKNRK